MRGETPPGCAPRRGEAHFNPLPSCEGRLTSFALRLHALNFNPLPSCEGRHVPAVDTCFRNTISIHSPHARGDKQSHQRIVVRHISIHSPHARGDRSLSPREVLRMRISIHSPHARGDPSDSVSATYSMHFNPLPSCEGRRPKPRKKAPALTISIHSPHARGDGGEKHRGRGRQFQSTPLMRGETCWGVGRCWAASAFQSTPLMRGETALAEAGEPEPAISIHSPHARGDPPGCDPKGSTKDFNPLPSCEGRLDVFMLTDLPIISIHSPHARGDSGQRFSGAPRGNFNPLPSCEGRLRGRRA